MKHWLLLLMSVLLISVSIFSLLYFGFGLSEYIHARKSVNKLTGDDKVKAEGYLNGDSQKGFIAGILAYTGSFNGKEYIGVWNKTGLKIFNSGGNPVGYSRFYFCTDENLGVVTSSKNFKATRDIGAGIKDWVKLGTKKGDYVYLQLSKVGEFYSNKYLEVHSTDIWTFGKFNLIDECKTK